MFIISLIIVVAPVNGTYSISRNTSQVPGERLSAETFLKKFS